MPGDEGRYEWKGFRKSDELPFEFNPPRHFIATANHNILPAGYQHPAGLRGWALPFRVDRIREMLTGRPQEIRRGRFRAHAAGRGFAARAAFQRCAEILASRSQAAARRGM